MVYFTMLIKWTNYMYFKILLFHFKSDLFSYKIHLIPFPGLDMLDHFFTWTGLSRLSGLGVHTRPFSPPRPGSTPLDTSWSLPSAEVRGPAHPLLHVIHILTPASSHLGRLS